MANLSTGNWIAIISLIVAVVGVYLTWRSMKKRKPDTTNIAVDSDRVEQSGGSGTTQNKAKGSTDVNQSG